MAVESELTHVLQNSRLGGDTSNCTTVIDCNWSLDEMSPIMCAGGVAEGLGRAVTPDRWAAVVESHPILAVTAVFIQHG